MGLVAQVAADHQTYSNVTTFSEPFQVRISPHYHVLINFCQGIPKVYKY